VEVNPLSVTPNEAQSCLLDVVYDGRELAGGPCFHPVELSHVPHRVGPEPDAWPIFQYVEAVLYREHGLDARAVISEAPSIRFGAGQGRYAWVQADRPGATLQAEDKVRLTVAGMSRVTEATAEVEAFIETLALFVERERRFAPHATEVQTVEVSSGEIRQCLERRWVIGDDDNLTALVELLRREPSTWHCQVAPTENGPWSVRLSPFLRTYTGVTSPVEYVDRLVETIGLPLQPPLPLHPSSLSLPEAIDYLNAIWRAGVGNGKALIRISRAEAAAKLALDCATVDELESRLSALAGILGQLRLPTETGDKKLVDLGEFLGRILKDDVATRAQDAVDVLRDIVALRVWRQHPGTDKVGSKAARRLGIAFPSESWGATWTQIRELAVAALSAIREEIEQLSPS
jgi:hypothetical protein